MINTIIKAMYSAFISIVLISIILVVWTGFAYVSQSSKSSEITKEIQDMYSSQKSVVIDIIDLSKILIKDNSQSKANENSNVVVNTELISDLDEKSQLDLSPITDDIGDNPLGIVIEPSLSEIIEEPLVNDQNEFSINEMELNS